MLGEQYDVKYSNESIHMAIKMGEDELVKEFIITKEEVREIMEEFGDTTESLYFHIMQKRGLRKPNKKKVIELMKYQHGI